MLKPTALPCGHCDCQECLAKLLALKPNPKCPLCKKCIPSNDPLNINYILHDITGKLQIKAAIGLVRTMAPNIMLIGAKELKWNVRIMGAQTF